MTAPLIETGTQRMKRRGIEANTIEARAPSAPATTGFVPIQPARAAPAAAPKPATQPAMQFRQMQRRGTQRRSY